jgi:hypothetical protein
MGENVMSATARGLANGHCWDESRTYAADGSRVTRVWDEWRWPLLFSLVVAVVLEVPFRLAASHGQDGLTFVGML